jgi:hypothetical protein
MTCLFFSFLLIYKTRPSDFVLQLGRCISDAFSIFLFDININLEGNNIVFFSFAK